MRSVSRSPVRRLLGAVAGVLLVLACLPAAAAAAITIDASPDKGVVGEQVTFSTTYLQNCADTQFVWEVDGATQPSTTRTMTTSLSAAGSYEVTVSAASQDCESGDSGTLTYAVRTQLEGSIAVSPDPPVTGREATLSATQTGGHLPYTYEWDTDDDGDFDDGDTRTVTATFATAGPHVVRVRITDDASPPHVDVVVRTLQVVDEPAPSAGTPPPPPPPCTKRVAFGLSEFKTPGCFTRAGTAWETTSAVTLNGLSFPDFGQRFRIQPPGSGEPGGRFTAPSSAMQFDGRTIFTGDIDWPLPGGRQGEHQEWRSIAVPPAIDLFRLRVRGSVGVRLGWGADGRYYALLPFHLELPAVFKPMPDPTAESVTADATVRVDDGGAHYDGLKLDVEDVWIGRIKVPEACFSLVPRGAAGAVAPCAGATLDGRPYIACSEDAGTDRWDGNATIQLPVADEVRYTLFGGFADGRVTRLGGAADNISSLGIPLAPGLVLNRLAAGMCFNDPVTVRGDVGAEALKGKLLVNGRFLYTDPTYRGPWSIEVGGNAVLAGLSLGEGRLRLNASGDVGFGLSASLNVDDVVSFTGEADGWVEPSRDVFNVAGSGRGCLRTLCAAASGVVSSTGLAGCVDAGVIEVWVPVNGRTGSFGWGSTSFDVVKRAYPLKAGFGHRFGGGVDLLGNSCDFSAYSATRSASVVAGAAQGGLTQRIAPGTRAVSLRVKGSGGPPKLVLRGPGGAVITSPEDRPAAQRKGEFMLVEDEDAGTTNVLLVGPAAGTWTIRATPGTSSTPTRVDRAVHAAPAVFVGQTRKTARGRDFAMAYAAPTGTTVQLVERGRGVARTLVRAVEGRACKGRRTLRGGRRLRCAQVSFTPSRGPGGVRRIQAVVRRGAIPVSRQDVATFKVPNQQLPARPAALRARRGDGIVQVSIPRAAGASRYVASAVLSDGRRLGFDLEARCQALVIVGVPRDVAATVEVAGLRYDTAMGRTRSVTLRANATAAGPRGRLPRRLWRPRVVCD